MQESAHRCRQNQEPAEEDNVAGRSLPASSGKREISRLHKLDRFHRLKFRFDGLAFVLLSITSVVAWKFGLWPLAVLLWIPAAHFGHVRTLSFHDASHGTLHPSRPANEILGTIVGTVILVPLSVYRHAHAAHHTFMSTHRDPELWPFVIPGTSRWFRILTATAEILLGVLVGPLLFLRSVVVAENMTPRFRRRIVWEYVLMIGFWSAVLCTVHFKSWWMYFLVGYAGPATIAGMLQTLNKYMQHMGLFGDSVLAGTRTVVAGGSIGKLLSDSLQNNDHHGTHHRYAKIPHYNLPQATPCVFENETTDLPVFGSYAAALFDMMKTLANPRVGAQWLSHDESRQEHHSINVTC